MKIQVKSILNKTLKPPEVDLAYKKGVIIQSLDDGSGLFLVDFGFIQWYVHEQDFHLYY